MKPKSEEELFQYDLEHCFLCSLLLQVLLNTESFRFHIHQAGLCNLFRIERSWTIPYPKPFCNVIEVLIELISYILKHHQIVKIINMLYFFRSNYKRKYMVVVTIWLGKPKVCIGIHTWVTVVEREWWTLNSCIFIPECQENMMYLCTIILHNVIETSSILKNT